MSSILSKLDHKCRLEIFEHKLLSMNLHSVLVAATHNRSKEKKTKRKKKEERKKLTSCRCVGTSYPWNVLW